MAMHCRPRQSATPRSPVRCGCWRKPVVRIFSFLSCTCVSSAAPRVPLGPSTLLPPGVLGPPAHLDGLQRASQSLSVSRECSISGAPIGFQVARLAARPVCFQLSGFLSAAECEHIIRTADAAGLEPAATAGGHDARRGCDVAWLDVASDGTVAAVSDIIAKLFLRPEVRTPSAWIEGGRFENLQVLKYGPAGEFKLHYDATEEMHRVCTVLLYLNGVGGTWFPLALRDARDGRDSERAELSTELAAEWPLRAAEQLSPERDGLLLRPRRGDAVIFYNLREDGDVDRLSSRLSLHAGLPAPAEKSVAALWYSVGLRVKHEAGLNPRPLAVDVGSRAY